MKTSKKHTTTWQGYAVSVMGRGHLQRGIPCQDASLTWNTPRPGLVVCDGKGSASHSHFGARRAVQEVARQCYVLEPLLAAILDSENSETLEEQWQNTAQLLYRAMAEVQLRLSRKHGLPCKEFEFTTCVAMVGKRRIGLLQVGDGAMVVRQKGKCRTVFALDKGEFANHTTFVRPGKETLSFHTTLVPTQETDGIAATSDGPEHLMFHLRTMTPGPIFDCFFDNMASGEMTREDLREYLTRKDWDVDARGHDDRTVAVLTRPGSVEKQDDFFKEKEDAEETLKPEEFVKFTKRTEPLELTMQKMETYILCIFLELVFLSILGSFWQSLISSTASVEDKVPSFSSAAPVWKTETMQTVSFLTLPEYPPTFWDSRSTRENRYGFAVPQYAGRSRRFQSPGRKRK